MDWSPRKGALILLKLLLELSGIEKFVFLIDETFERRKGCKIRAKDTIVMPYGITITSRENFWFKMVGDGGFACARLAWKCFKLNVALVSRLKMNARIYPIPGSSPKGKQGRKPIKGARLITFKEMVQKDEAIQLKGFVRIWMDFSLGGENRDEVNI